MYINFPGPLCLFPTEVRSRLPLMSNCLSTEKTVYCYWPFLLLEGPVSQAWAKADATHFKLARGNTLSRYRVTIYGVYSGSSICWTITNPWIQVIKTVSLIHKLHSSIEHTHKSSQPAVSSPVCWYRLPTADVHTLGFRTVPVPQLQQLSTKSPVN
jgi:hypothetical protein